MSSEQRHEVPEASFSVCMLVTPRIADAAQQAVESWSSYCDRHGYGFSVCREQLVADMHVNWSKIEMMRRQFRSDSARWLVMVDADTRVARPEVPLEGLVDRHPGKDLVFAAHAVWRFGVLVPIGYRGLLRCRRWRAPNAGMVLVRNNAFGRQFFEDWLALARGRLRGLAAAKAPNQQVMWTGLFARHRRRIGVMSWEVARVDTNRWLDRWAFPRQPPLVEHHKVRWGRAGPREG